ncbi:hypothetical protein [Agaribacterium sp. ZY112]|uniref:hypothetical protein n=1 Tax=Agaribacterium sp. ZY112 TaxID=3233574 RepID=UPI003523DAD9
MSLGLKFSLGFVFILLLFFLVRFLVLNQQDLSISESSYECSANACDYSFTVKNDSDFRAEASVRVQLSAFGGIKGDERLAMELVPMSVAARSSETYSASIVSDKTADSVIFVLSERKP